MIQAFFFFIEWLELVILASSTLSRVAGDETASTCSVQLVDNLPAMPQIRRKDQPILAPTQRTIEDAEFPLVIKLGTDHLIKSFPSFLECRSHFRHILKRTSDENVITMHRPRDGAQLIVEAATRHSAHGETAAGEQFSQLISPRCCSWTGSVQRLAQLPNMGCQESSRFIVWQLNKGVPLLFSMEISSPNVKHGNDNVFTLGQSSCVCDHIFD